MNRALVIGQGSIGRRHARILGEENCAVGLVSRHARGPGTYPDLAAALADFAPDYVVIANETSGHAESLRDLAAAGFEGAVLVEKPLFSSEQHLPAGGFDRLGFRRLAVGYNLRFHPLVLRLRDWLTAKKLLAVQVHCGQYLPTWRPDSDYRASYSASRARGGGVLRDLSHELDYLALLCGPWTSLTAAGGRMGSLEIDTDDQWLVTMRLASGALASVALDYWHRPGRRVLVAVTEQGTAEADFIAGTLTIDGERTVFEVERDETYRAMHRAMLSGTPVHACSPEEAMKVLRTIAAIEEAAARQAWIEA